jgi:hypothetical protein
MTDLYPEDTILRVTGREHSVNAISGALEDSTLTGGTGSAYLALTRDGAALAGTTLTLTEATDGGVYYNTWTKAALLSALSGVADGATVWRLVTFTGAVPVATALTWHTGKT